MIQTRLVQMKDDAYAAFVRGIVPTVDGQTILGIRTPALRKFAKELHGSREAEAFMRKVPHRYFEENQLHAFLISEERVFETCVAQTDDFLSYVDNWATCDQLSPNVFRMHRAQLLPWIRQWLASDQPYRVRFGVSMLMVHFLDVAFNCQYLEWVAGLRWEDYYVRMMVAWYFATALAKQYDASVPYLEAKRLPPWVHQKTIQKAVESRRISEAQKAYLKTLRISKRKSAQ